MVFSPSMILISSLVPLSNHNAVCLLCYPGVKIIVLSLTQTYSLPSTALSNLYV